MDRNLSNYAFYLREECGRGERTIEAYLGDLQRFRAFLDKRDDLPLRWEEIGADDVRDWFASLHSPSPLYLRRLRSSLLMFYKYLIDIRKVMSHNPVREIATRKKAFRHPSALSISESTRLVQAAFDYSRPHSRTRNWATIIVLLHTGLRLSEFCAMRRQDLSKKNGLPHSLRVIGKGNKERKILLSEEAQRALHQWLQKRRDLVVRLPPEKLDDGSVWLTTNGRYKGNAWHHDSVRYMIGKMGKLAGISKRVHPHLLRHTFATEAVRAGAKLHAVSEALGHSSIATTGIYLHADEAELEAIAAILPSVVGFSRVEGGSSLS